MKKKEKRTKNSYTSEFKTRAVELAKEIGTKSAAEKLGLINTQTLGSWVRYDKKLSDDSEFCELEQAKAEIKKLRKEAAEDKKVIAILKDCTAFFCQDQLK